MKLLKLYNGCYLKINKNTIRALLKKQRIAKPASLQSVQVCKARVRLTLAFWLVSKSYVMLSLYV